MKKLDHVVTNNINNKNQCNYTIEYDPKFDSKSSLSSGTKDPLPVVSVSILGDKKKRVTIISSLPSMFYIRSTNCMIKSQHTKPYKFKMHSNNVEYRTCTGKYCTTHDFKVEI